MSKATMPHGNGIDPNNVGAWLPGYETVFVTHVDYYAIESTASQADLDAAVAHALAGDPPPGLRVLSLADFQRRFTPQEYFAAKQLVLTDANMAFIFGLFESSLEVRLDHADTQAGVAYMQYVAGIVTAERAAEILA